MEKSIEVHNLTVSYHSKPVLWDVDFELPKGKIIGVVGPNGSGKTSLLRTSMRLKKPASSYTELFSRPFRKRHSRDTYQPQLKSRHMNFRAY